jgi:hypothetical protein
VWTLRAPTVLPAARQTRQRHRVARNRRAAFFASHTWHRRSNFYWVADGCPLFFDSDQCWITASKLRLKPEDGDDAKELRACRSMSVTFLALGVNKQLDLQTALTEIGRVFPNFQGTTSVRPIGVYSCGCDRLSDCRNHPVEVGAQGPTPFLVCARSW